jgi:TP901 family phage tail tape measure protein
MSVRTDTVNLIVNIKGDAAKNEMNNLRKKAADINEEMKGLTRGTAEYAAKAKELKQVKADMDALKKSIGLTALTQKELMQELKNLKAQRGSITPFTKEFTELSKQIKLVENRLYEVRNGVQGFASFFSKIKDEVKQFGMMAAAYLGFQFISSQFRNIIGSAGKLSDSLADLRRVSGLTAEEVDRLNKRFGELDTRTSTDKLREIAIIAGKLGVAKADIYGFTAAVDQLVVALGDELGDADQITTQLGKILNVFDGKVDADNISRLGNSFVVLANAGVASGGFIADFTQRVSGIAKSANLSLGSTVGLAAGLEELGQRSESSSTAIQKLLSTIASDLPKAAKIAGAKTSAEIQQFANDFATKPQEALVKFAEGLTKNKTSFAEVASSFKDAGEEGARVVGVLQAIGQNGEFMRTKMTLGNESLKNTTAITEAFALKNETFGASLDKLGKEFYKLITSPGITNFLKGAVEGAFAFIKAIKNIPQFIAENKAALLTMLAGVLLLNMAYIVSALVTARDTVAKGLNAIAARAVAVWTAIATTAQSAWALIVGVATGKVTLATAAQRIYNAALAGSTRIIGGIVIAIGALILILDKLLFKEKELSAEKRVQAELDARVAESVGETQSQMKLLTAIASDNNIQLGKRKQALQELININPEYLKGLTLENLTTAKGIEIMDLYIKKLRETNRAKAVNDLTAEMEKELAKQEAGIANIRATAVQVSGGSEVRNNKGVIKNLAYDLFGIGEGSNVQQLEDLEKQAKKTRESLDILYGTIKQNVATGATAVPGTGASNVSVNVAIPKTKPEKSSSKNGDDLKSLKDEADKFYTSLSKIKERALLKNEEIDQAEIDAVNMKYKELLDKAKDYFTKHAVTKSQFDQAEKQITEAKQAELSAIFNKYQKKRFEEIERDEYEKSLSYHQEYIDQLKIDISKQYAEGLISEKQYNEKIKKIELDAITDRVTIAQDYSATVKKAETDLVQFKKAAETAVTNNKIDENKKRKESDKEATEFSKSENISKLKRAVFTTRPGTDANLKAQKALLEEQFKQETEHADQLSEMYKLKEQEKNDAIKDMELENFKQKFERVMNFVNAAASAFNSLNQLLNNREERQLQKDRAANNQKKKQFKDQLDNKLISQAQHDKLVNNLQEQQDKQEREIKRRQAKREKALNIFQAVINTASAIVEALPNVPLSILAGVLGGIQVAAIASTPLPEAGKGGFFTTGDKHSDASGGIPVMIERDEAVINARTMRDSNRYTVTGTPAQITSALNSQAGGVQWAGGAVVNMAKWLQQKQAGISPALVRSMQLGGLAAGRTANAGTDDGADGSMQATNELLRQLIAQQALQTQEIKTMKTKLHAVVSIKEYREQEEVFDAAAAAAAINQKAS